MGSELKKTAKKLAFTQQNGVAFGEVSGYMTTLSEENGRPELFISVFINTEEAFYKINEAINNYEYRQSLKIQDSDVSENHVKVTFLSVSTSNDIISFINWFYPNLMSHGVLGTNCCSRCKQPISSGEDERRLIRNRAYVFHGSCAQKISPARPGESDIEDEEDYKEKPERDSNARGVLGAVLGGLLGFIPFTILISYGLIVGYLGVLIGFCVLMGYVKLGGKAKASLFPIVLGSTFFFIILGQFVGICYNFKRYALNGIHHNMAFSDISLALVNLIINNSEYRQLYILDFVRCLLVTIFALGIVFIIRSRRSRVR